MSSNCSVASLQDKLKGATAAHARVATLESTVSEKEVEVKRLSFEVASVKSQLLKAEESRDAQWVDSPLFLRYLMTGVNL